MSSPRSTLSCPKSTEQNISKCPQPMDRRLSCRAALARPCLTFAQLRTQKLHPCTGVALHLWKHDSFVDSRAEGGCPPESHHTHNLHVQLHISSAEFSECPSMWLYAHVCESHGSQHKARQKEPHGAGRPSRAQRFSPTPLGFLWSFQQGFTPMLCLPLLTEPSNELCYLHTLLQSPVSPILYTAMCTLEYCK